MALYLFEGALGFPVFTLARGGLIHLMGPTGGYLIGYAFGAFAAGQIFLRSASKWGLILALLCGHFAIYLVGIPYLAAFVPVRNLLALGLYPFLPGVFLKSFALAASPLRAVCGK